MPRGDSCRSVGIRKRYQASWGLGFQPSNTKYQETGKGNSWQLLHPHAPTSLSALEGWNSLLASGTGVAITAHVALSGGYIWNNIYCQRAFSSRDCSKLSGKNWRGVHKCSRDSSSMLLDYIHFCYQIQWNLRNSHSTIRPDYKHYMLETWL